MPPYRRIRLAERIGVGPMTVYRVLQFPADDRFPRFDHVQLPQRWARRQPEYITLEAAQMKGGDVVGAAEHLATQGADRLRLVKALQELIYERIRLEIAPTMPSRLESVYAFIDPLDAFAFAERMKSIPRAVFQATVPEGTPWAVVDMNYFPTGQEGDIGIAAEKASRDAPCYWTTDGNDLVPEILIPGAIQLVGNSMEVVPWLVEQGLVE